MTSEHSPTNKRPDLQNLNLKNPVHLLAFGLGSGTARKAPGTFGTIAALPFWWFLLQGVPTLPYLGILIAGFALGVVLCEITSRDLGVHDHGGIVWDEWIGVWITLMWLPMGGGLLADLVRRARRRTARRAAAATRTGACRTCRRRRRSR